jgi:hypothetical protein
MGSNTGFESARSADRRSFWDDPEQLDASPRGVTDRLTESGPDRRACVVARAMGRDLDGSGLIGVGRVRVGNTRDPLRKIPLMLQPGSRPRIGEPAKRPGVANH